MLPLLLLSGCGAAFRLFHPEGPVASAEFHYTLLNTAVMLLIILPTAIATFVFAFRYRKSSSAPYDPSFSHSYALELAMWGGPLGIVVILAFCTYQSVFAVNPGGPSVLDNGTHTFTQAPGKGDLQVDVITTDWQWIFVYPQYRIATIDDLVVPVGRTIRFELTSSTVVNDFFIPQVAPMIDVMPGMRTLDAFRENRPGSYEGFSADFSGAGFSWMQFSTRVLPTGDFAAWVARTQRSPDHLDFARFQQIAHPTINDGAKPAYFSNADPDLFLEVYKAVQNGAVFPVPMETMTKAPTPVPVNGDNKDIKTTH